MSTTAVLPQTGLTPADTPPEPAPPALAPSPEEELEAEMLVEPNTPAARLPVEVDVAIPLRDFRVRNLLTLEPGVLIESLWVNGEDVPLGSGDIQLAWSEFEVVDSQLAVRLTRLV